MDLGRNIRRATLEIVVLRFLSHEELYVYEMIQKIDELSGGLYTVPEATIYPVMYRLLEKGLISDREVKIGRRVRVYYSITDSGKAYFEEILKEYCETMHGLNKILKESENDE